MKNGKSSVLDILKDLEDIFTLAMSKGNFSVALKTRELLGRELGLFRSKINSSKKEGLKLTDFSEEDLNRLVDKGEQQLHLDSKGHEA
jgi:hypothetical protein